MRWPVATALFLGSGLLPTAIATCSDPSPSYPVPDYDQDIPHLSKAIKSLQDTFDLYASNGTLNTTSVSIEITSKSKTLGSVYKRATNLSSSNTGTKDVDGDTVFRIASISKTFTVLALLKLQKDGKLNLDDPVRNYIKELQRPKEDPNDLPFKDITLRSLASQLSGMPRTVSQGDLLFYLPDPTAVGLPPRPNASIPQCEQGVGKPPCTENQFLGAITNQTSVFAPNQRSTYSNDAFTLLGLVVARVSGQRYEDVIQDRILTDIGMPHSTFAQPENRTGAIPDAPSDWVTDLGVDKPTGGLYTSASDMSKYLRWILAHYNGITPALNWFNPASFGDGQENSYGIPWEIFRTNRKAVAGLNDAPITFVTKSGSLTGYYSEIVLMPDFELGVTLLIAGESNLYGPLLEIVLSTIAAAAEQDAAAQAASKLAGTYVSRDPGLNSSLTLSVDPAHGVLIERFISNSTDVFGAVGSVFSDAAPPSPLTGPYPPQRAQLTPTLLFADQAAMRGAKYRLTLRAAPDPGIFGSQCLTDIDPYAYAGIPATELVFYDEAKDGGETGRAVRLELPAWDAVLHRTDDKVARGKWERGGDEL